MGQRYHDANLARWSGEDLLAGGLSNPQSFNRFAARLGQAPARPGGPDPSSKRHVQEPRRLDTLQVSGKIESKEKRTMVADTVTPQRMSVEEWRELERASEVRHEYIDGYVYAMSRGTLANTVIAGNIYALATSALGDRPCLAFMAGAAARISESRYTYPDVVITCEDNGIASVSASEVNEPLVIFEVLSKSTEHYDRTRKFGYYRACPSLREYVLVSTEYQMVEVYRRTAEGWGILRFYGFADTVELSTVDIMMPVAAIYRRTDVPEALPEGAP